MRHRGPAQRRQVHPLQCPHQGRHRGRELPVLHHRAECRHRRAARPAPDGAGGRSSSPSGSCRRSSSSSTSRAWWLAPVQGRGAGEPVPEPHPRDRRHRQRGALLRGCERDPRRPARSTRSPTSRSSRPSCAWPTSSTVEKSLRALCQGRPQAGNDKEAAAPRQGAAQKCQAALDEGAAGAKHRLQQGRVGHPEAAVPDHGQAGDVRRQREPRTGFENNPFLDRLREYAAKPERTGGGDLRQDREPSWPTCPTRTRRCSWPRWGRTEPGPEPPHPRRVFKLLGLQTYFTAGVKEVRAWTIHIGDTAPQAAGVIHTDFERGFIRAQTIAFADFVAHKRRAGRQGCGQDARRGQGVRRP